MSSNVFAEELCDAYPAVSAAADSGTQVLKDMSYFFGQVAKASETYANTLTKLCSVPPGTSMFAKFTGDPAITKETKTLKEAVTATVEGTSKLGEIHSDFAKKVQEEIVKALDEFHKKKEAEKKKIQADGNKKMSEFQANINNVNKLKAAYEKACTAAAADKEASKKAIDAASAGGADEKTKKKLDAAANKADTRARGSAKKAKDAEKALKAAIDKANEYKAEFYRTTMPSTMTALQKLHEERFEEIVSFLKFYTAALAAVPAGVEESIEVFKEKVETDVNLAEDMEEFVENTKTEEGPGELKFEQHEFFGKKEKKEEKKEEKKDDDDDDDDDDDEESAEESD